MHNLHTHHSKRGFGWMDCIKFLDSHRDLAMKLLVEYVTVVFVDDEFNNWIILAQGYVNSGSLKGLKHCIIFELKCVGDFMWLWTSTKLFVIDFVLNLASLKCE